MHAHSGDTLNALILLAGANRSWLFRPHKTILKMTQGIQTLHKMNGVREKTPFNSAAYPSSGGPLYAQE